MFNVWRFNQEVFRQLEVAIVLQHAGVVYVRLFLLVKLVKAAVHVVKGLGKFYGSVTAKEVSDELKKQHGIEIDKRMIRLAEPIKTYGKYELDVKYYQDVTGKLNLIVTEKE